MTEKKWPWHGKKVLDIDAKLHKTRNRVYRVGVELEGGWVTLPPGTTLQNDGSVSFPREDSGFDPRTGETSLNIGELPSPVLMVDSRKADDLTLEKWLTQHYPQKVNKTCGMHVHMSFQNAFQYQRLMDESYTWTMGEYVRRWAKENLPLDHCIWSRLRGESQYCTFKYYPDGQAQQTRKQYHHDKDCRYTVIHYCFSRFGTIECRLLPMMPDAQIALSAIKEVLAITSAFLVTTTSKRELPITEGWTAENDPIHREIVSATV
jgi:hypothetical protein